jgi:hypothetical protein
LQRKEKRLLLYLRKISKMITDKMSTLPFFVVQQQSIVMLVWQDVYFDLRLRKGLSADVLASISLFDPNRKPVHFWPKMSIFSPS